jgi:hypothetical protein
VPSYNGDGTLRKQVGAGETTFDVYGIRPTRRVEQDGSFRTEIIAIIQQRLPMRPDGAPALGGVKKGEPFSWFRGGATVIIDPRDGSEEIRFSILKNTDSTRRQTRQLETIQAASLSPLRALYFGGQATEPFAMLHAVDDDDKDEMETANG